MSDRSRVALAIGGLAALYVAILVSGARSEMKDSARIRWTDANRWE